MVTPKAKGFRPQTLKLVKTWIPYSTPSFILREVKGLRGHLSKSRKDFSLNYWWESQPSFPQQSDPHQVFWISFIAIKCSLCYEVICMFIKNILSLAWHFLFFAKVLMRASFVSKILRICTLSGWVLGNNLKAKLPHFSPLDNSFPGNRKFKCSASAANIAKWSWIPKQIFCIFSQ